MKFSRKRPDSARPKGKFNKRLAAYATAAAVTMGGPATRDAEAVEIIFDLPDLTTPLGTLGTGTGTLFLGGAIVVDVDGGAAATSTSMGSGAPLGTATDIALFGGNITKGSFAATVGKAKGTTSVSFLNQAPSTATSSSSLLAALLPSGFAVGGTVTAFRPKVGVLGAGNTSGSAGAFVPSPRRGFIGFIFPIGGDLHAGWADVTYSVTAGMPNQGRVTLHRFGYNNQDGVASVTPASQVPEPSSIALLALGAAGLAGWRARRRKRKQDSKAPETTAKFA